MKINSKGYIEPEINKEFKLKDCDIIVKAVLFNKFDEFNNCKKCIFYREDNNEVIFI